MNILIVEDDPILNRNMLEALTSENHLVEAVYDGILAETLLRRNHYDCVILDVNLPGKSGFDLCKDVRTKSSETIIVMLTAFDELEDKVKGFENGADEYITKPFFMRELLIRIQILEKRIKTEHTQTGKSDSIQVGSILIQKQAKKVFRFNQEIVLTPREYQILLRLAENHGEVVGKKELISEIWGNSVDVNTNTIEVYVNFLRNKLDKPFDLNSIKTKVGYGYYLEE